MEAGSTAKAQAGASGARQTSGEAEKTLGKAGRFLAARLNLPGWKRQDPNCRPSLPGSAPGIESMPEVDQSPPVGTVRVCCTDYGPDRIETREIVELAPFLLEARPAWCRVRWLNVDGLHPNIVNQLRNHFQFHTLAAEDVLRVPQRPKLESYDGHLFLVARMLMMQNRVLTSEQVSFFLFKDTLITFQERTGDVWDPIRQRMQKAGSRLRTYGASYLLYALLDAVVDHCFPILENYGESLEEMENEVAENPTPQTQRRLHAIKRELAGLRRVLWPMREVMNELYREETGQIAADVKTYIRDVADHTVQVMDIVESCRESVGGLHDLYMSAVSNRTNEVMKVLTIMASFFIPITFVAGVYGMNFEILPELRWKYSYAMFWLICLAISGGLAVYFIRKGWIGRK